MHPCFLTTAFVVTLLAASAQGCASRAQEVMTGACELTVGGLPSDSTAVAGARDLYGMTVQLTLLESREGTVAYEVAVTGASVRRALAPPGGTEGTLCGPRPSPQDPCSAIDFGTFAHDLDLRLLDTGTPSASLYVDALRVSDWRELDPAIAVVSDALRARRIATPFVVELTPPDCVIELGAQR